MSQSGTRGADRGVMEVHRLRWMMITGFLVVVILLSGTTFYSLTSLHDTYEDIERELEASAHKIKVATAGQVAGFRRVEILYLMASEDDPFELDEFYLTYFKTGYDVGLARNTLRELLTTEEELEEMARQDRIIAAVVDTHDAIADLAKAERQQEAALLLKEQAVALHTSGNATFQRLRELQELNAERIRKRAAEAYRQAWYQSSMLILGSILLSLLIGYQVYRMGGRMATRVQHQVGDLEVIANRDQLTGLLNRTGLMAQLAKMQAEHLGQGSLLYLDLDGFKHVNDAHGHGIGDHFLHMAAKRIRSGLKERDVVARIGGDEFVVLLVGSTCLDAAKRVADDVLKRFSEQFSFQGIHADIGVSIGIAISRGGEDARQLLARADQAMYAAKHAGRGRYMLADPPT